MNENVSAVRSHYNDVIMSVMASQITASRLFTQSFFRAQMKERKLQSTASLAFMRGNHWWPENSPHKRSVTRKMFPIDDVIVIMPEYFQIVTPCSACAMSGYIFRIIIQIWWLMTCPWLCLHSPILPPGIVPLLILRVGYWQRKVLKYFVIHFRFSSI